MCVCGMCVIYFSPARPKCGHMDYGGRLEDDLSTGRLSMCVYRPAVAFFFAFFFSSMVVLYNT